jgi:hypothetical protein
MPDSTQALIPLAAGVDRLIGSAIGIMRNKVELKSPRLTGLIEEVYELIAERSREWDKQDAEAELREVQICSSPFWMGPFTWQICDACNYNRHQCPGCGADLNHAQTIPGANYHDCFRDLEE